MPHVCTRLKFFFPFTRTEQARDDYQVARITKLALYTIVALDPLRNKMNTFPLGPGN